MMQLHKLIATAGGIGYIGKGGGTIAAIVYCLIYLLIPAGNYDDYRQAFFTVLICILGTWSSNVVDTLWGKDSNKVVIDEVAGMMITLLFVPVTIKYVITGLVLFRFFDILKPLLIRRLESLPKGWGVMADDILAGVYSYIILSLIVKYNIY